jgi:twitching motility two-component system response regulator PilH
MGKRVLVVEDEADSARYLTLVLSDEGYEPVWANSSDQGWQEILAQAPDLICLDIMMPKNSGLALYRQVKSDQRFADIPVVVVSGAIDAASFRIGDFLPGAALPEPNAFIEKPIAVPAFLKTVETIIGN